MAYKVEWLIPHQVIYCQFIDETNTDEIAEANKEIVGLMDTCPKQRVHVIADTLNLEKAPVKIQQVSQASQSVRHHNSGWYVVVTNNQFFRFISNIVGQMWHKSQVKAAASVKEAIDILKKNTSGIDWSQLGGKQAL